MKQELLVTVGQHTTVNTFPGLVHTARHTTKVGALVNAGTYKVGMSGSRTPRSIQTCFQRHTRVAVFHFPVVGDFLTGRLNEGSRESGVAGRNRELY